MMMILTVTKISNTIINNRYGTVMLTIQHSVEISVVKIKYTLILWKCSKYFIQHTTSIPHTNLQIAQHVQRGIVITYTAIIC